ncbi:leucine-rich repeat extensin-like protein 4 [Impatiens glandulifera]|uniref:leucine-rich repeat extensin-like protein 4 n=1 Tax=Impatiens glandulifera TaxID=253017 RepID=UPI001FB17F0A|nr:leucine-rich repeat extensin-like protein 4 [Impatiens glandulifera]
MKKIFPFNSSLTIIIIIINAIAIESASNSFGRSGIGAVWYGRGTNDNISPYTALQAWKSAITDDPSKILDSWVGSNVCNYKGVFCVQSTQNDYMGSNGPTIAAIDLNHANLQGTLVKELSILTDLSLLHLNSNRFTGTVPDSFRSLFSLTELDLSNNLFSGQFPSSTLLIPNLLYIDLRFNNFYGRLPQELFNRRLDAIFLNNNQFGGEIPQNLGNSPASVINLANNNFSGEIPFSFGYMGPRLKEILFINNQLTGCIPEGVGIWQNLQVLDLSFNSLMGQLPDSVSCLAQIEVLNLGHNRLSGDLPELVCELRNLLNLTVAYNFFSGFSQECSKLLNRNVGFDFSLNCIPGKDMQRPRPECFMIPGGGLNCLRVPSPNSLLCGTMMVESHQTNSTTSTTHSSP